MKKLSSVLVVFVAIMFLSSASVIAGDCKDVRFKFTNSTGAKVKVQKMNIKGNDGSWSEDIANHQIDTNHYYTTDKRNMNKLDSGKKGDFTVLYERWDAPNNKWQEVNQTFFDKECNDGKTFSFTLTNKK